MTIAFIALGANKTAWQSGKALSPRQAVCEAVSALDALPGSYVVASSGMYVTPPIGPGRQRPYVNAVAAVETALGLEALIAALHDVEATFRRQRKRAWQARSLDLDILDFGGVVHPGVQDWARTQSRPWPNRLALRSSFLKAARHTTVPHVRLHQRGFVVLPLLELCPNWLHPIYNTTVSHLARSIDRGSIRRVGAITL